MTFVLLVAAVAVTSVLQYSAPARADSAVVIKDISCIVLDGNGHLYEADASHAVITSSGNTNFKCSATNVPNSTGGAVHFDFNNTNLTCGTPGGGTTDWQEVVSASGNATLTCKVH
jgi:hypothetical protein